MSCVLPESIKKLQEEIKAKGGASYLRSLISEERIDFLAQFVDSKYDKDKTNANILNRQIENKMLEPAQAAAVQEWLRNLPKDKRTNTLARDNDIIEFVKQNKQILSPKDGKAFMESLVKQRLGFEATVEDTKELVNFANTASERRKVLSQVVPGWDQMEIGKFDEMTKDGEAREARNKLGDSLLDFKEKMDEMAIKASDPYAWNEILKAPGAMKDKVIQIVYGAAGALKAGKASFDISFLFRQLSGAWFADPASAAKGAFKGVQQFGKSLVDANARRLTMREIMTRPNALNGNYDRFGLGIGIVEEAFAENVLAKGEKLLTRGKFNPFRASDDAMSVALQWTRAELFDSLWAQTKGDIQLLKAQDVGGAINTITGRGTLPVDNSKAEKFVNMMMFSPRWLSSRVQTITNLRYIGQYFNKTPNGLRARAATNNIIFMMGMASLVITARYAFGDEEDLEEMLDKTFDPRSADFLNGKFGNVHIDLSAGTNNLLRFGARFTMGQIITGEGALQNKSRGDIMMRYLMSKESPLAQNVSYAFLLATEKDPKDFNYNPIGYRTFAEAFLPISVQNLTEISKDDLPGTIGSVILDVVGVSSQYWEQNEKNADKSSAMIREQERLAYRLDSKVGSTQAAKNAQINTKLTGSKRDRANADFTRSYTAAADKLIASSGYRYLTDDGKKAALSKVRSDEMRKINKKYGLK